MRLRRRTMLVGIIVLWVFSDHFLIPYTILVDTLNVIALLEIWIGSLLIIIAPPTF